MTLEKAQIRGASWMSKIRAANAHYKKWETRFRCKKMVQYYEGKQWDRDPNDEGYVFNLFYATIGIKEPSLLFKRPQYFVAPAPSGSDFDPDSAYDKCLLATDTLNTLVGKKQMDYASNTRLAIHDSFFRFGMVEVGYNARWTLNPNANKPSFKSDYDPDETPGKVEDEPAEIPEEEWIYIKRIPAERVRIGTDDCFQLEKANWVAYYEWMRLADIKAKGSGFTNFSELPDPPIASNDEFVDSIDPETAQQGDLVKVWKIWDLRSRQNEIVVELGEVVVYTNDFKRLPLFGLRFTERTSGWYPIPLVYNWKSAQDEVNESKQQLRTHRRRSKRIYQAKRGDVDAEELDKLIEGPDGTLVETNVGNAIIPVQNTPVDQSVPLSMQTSNQDFNIIAGTTVEARLQTDRTTATQANLVNQHAQMRQTREQEVVAEWLCDIGIEILQQAIEKLSMPVWIKLSADTGEWGGEYQGLQQRYKKLHTDYLKGVGFNVDVQISSMSPVANDEEMNKYLKFLATLTQFPIISLHPDLVRETAYRLGYRNEKVIKYFMEAAQLAMIGKIEQGKQQLAAMQSQGAGMGAPNAAGAAQDSGNAGGNNMQRTVNQMAPGDIAAAQNAVGTAGMPSDVQ